VSGVRGRKRAERRRLLGGGRQLSRSSRHKNRRRRSLARPSILAQFSTLSFSLSLSLSLSLVPQNRTYGSPAASSKIAAFDLVS
jgi:hypothetical protein